MIRFLPRTQIWAAIASVSTLLVTTLLVTTACNNDASLQSQSTEQTEASVAAEAKDEAVKANRPFGSAARYAQDIDGAALPPFDIVFSPDGRYVASRSFEELVIWDIREDKEFQRLAFADDSADVRVFPNDIIFLPNAWRMVIAIGETVSVVDTKLGTEVASFTHNEKVDDVSFSADGQKILTYTRLAESGAGSVAVWDSQRGEKIAQLPYEQAYSAALSPNGESIITGGTDQTIRLWDTQTSREITRIDFDYETVSDNIPDRVGFVADSQLVWALIAGRLLRSWNIESGEAVLKIDDTGALPEISEDGQLAAVLYKESKESINGGSIGVWNIESGEEVFRIEQEKCNFSNYFSFDQRNRYLATACFGLPFGEGVPYTVFDLQSGKEISTPTPVLMQEGYGGFFLSPQGRWLTTRVKKEDEGIFEITTWPVRSD